jgi:hypothetical protein
MLRRYGCGSVYLRRGRATSTWYGRWWQDSRTPEGTLKRRYRKIRLGTTAELATKNDAREELRRHMGTTAKAETTMTFC